MGRSNMYSRVFLILAMFCTVCCGYSQENNKQQKRRGESAGYSTRDATTLSIMGWGLGLGAGIATLCALIPNNTEGQSAHAHD